MILGNDLSVFQGYVDWDTFKNNANFAFIKASEGDGFIDPQFSRNQAESRRVGLLRGYYHFARPDLHNAADAEAAFFLQTLGQLQEGEVLALDFEVTYNDSVSWCKIFLDYINANTGVKALVYLNQSLATSFNWQDVVSGGYGLWIAAYTYDPHTNTFQTGAWQEATMQQWTDKQQVPGISGDVDGDVFFGDATAFQKYGYHQVVTPDPLASCLQQNDDLSKEVQKANMKINDLQSQLNACINKPPVVITPPSPGKLVFTFGKYDVYQRS